MMVLYAWIKYKYLTICNSKGRFKYWAILTCTWIQGLIDKIVWIFQSNKNNLNTWISMLIKTLSRNPWIKRKESNSMSSVKRISKEFNIEFSKKKAKNLKLFQIKNKLMNNKIFKDNNKEPKPLENFS